jgi:hypothetical protein
MEYCTGEVNLIYTSRKMEAVVRKRSSSPFPYTNLFSPLLYTRPRAPEASYRSDFELLSSILLQLPKGIIPTPSFVRSRHLAHIPSFSHLLILNAGAIEGSERRRRGLLVSFRLPLSAAYLPRTPPDLLCYLHLTILFQAGRRNILINYHYCHLVLRSFNSSLRCIFPGYISGGGTKEGLRFFSSSGTSARRSCATLPLSLLSKDAPSFPPVHQVGA